MLDDLGDSSLKLKKMQKDIERLQNVAGRGGDSQHPGAGDASIQLGESAVASGDVTIAIGADTEATAWVAIAVGVSASAEGDHSLAVGHNAIATGEDSVALGHQTFAFDDRSVAIGKGATTSADDQVMLGTATHTVVVPGTFSNPSARRLKRRIEPAPVVRDVFPALHEWEYKADKLHRRHVGPLADDLVGTDGERYVTWDAKGRVSGIETLGLHTAQIYALRAENDELRARMTALEEELRSKNG